VTIQPVDPPVIVSTGYVPPPPTQIGMILGSIVGSSGSESTRSYVFRTVRVNTRKPRSGGLIAKDTIRFNGGGSFDSFDSSDPFYSSNGKYDSTKRKAGGIALSNSQAAEAIQVDSTHIYGSVVTGPGGTTTVNSGAVGSLAWNATQSGIEEGHSANDANVDFFDEQVPFTSGYATPGSATVEGTNYTYVVGPGNNKLGTVSLGSLKSMIVTGGDAVLYVDGAFVTSGSGYVYVAPGASLKLYVSGVFAVSGGGIVNGTSRADKLSVHGLNTCNMVNYSGSSAFIGTVNAPHAAFSFSGSAGAFGSFIAEKITISGGANVHYDEALNGSGYVVASWNEI